MPRSRLALSFVEARHLAVLRQLPLSAQRIIHRVTIEIAWRHGVSVQASRARTLKAAR